MIDKIKTYTDPLDPTANTATDNQWLDEDVYRELVKKTVVTCADIIITLTGVSDRVYLARRAVYPMKGLWFLGGRVQFNSLDMPSAAADNLERETGYKISSDKFKFLVVNDYKFIKAAQGDFPARSFAALFHLEVDAVELSQLSKGLVTSEYEPDFGLQPFEYDKLVQIKAHPAIIDAFRCIYK